MLTLFGVRNGAGQSGNGGAQSSQTMTNVPAPFPCPMLFLGSCTNGRHAGGEADFRDLALPQRLYVIAS